MQTNLLKDIKTYLKAAANRETELTNKQHELEEKVMLRLDHSVVFYDVIQFWSGLQLDRG